MVIGRQGGAGAHHQQQDVTGHGHVEGLEPVDGGEGRQLHQRVRISAQVRKSRTLIDPVVMDRR